MQYLCGIFFRKTGNVKFDFAQALPHAGRRLIVAREQKSRVNISEAGCKCLQLCSERTARKKPGQIFNHDHRIRNIRYRGRITLPK